MLASVMQMQLLPAVLALAAFLVAILLTLYIVRMLFGRRIRVSGGRNRPKRLDIVDAFDLDRERQLVIVRRDNIEHLLLIGGPSDVLIEAGFERPASAQTETKLEGREPRLPGPTAAPSWPSPPKEEEEAEEPPLAARDAGPRMPSPPAVGQPAGAPIGADALRRRVPEPPRPAGPRPPEPPRVPGAPPAPGARPSAPPPGRMGPPPPRGPEQQPQPAPGPRPDAPPPARPAAPGLGPRPAAPPPRPAPNLPPPRPTRPAPPPPAAPPPAENPPQEGAADRPRDSLESLESLEAEMARLLGRPEGH